MKMQEFCNGDEKALLKISVLRHDHDKPNEEHRLYGFFTTTVEIINSK
jgi:hypothetical protein